MGPGEERWEWRGKPVYTWTAGSGLLGQGILTFCGLERKLCQPSLPLGFMESSFLGRGIQLEEGQNRASNLEA